jgi:hypothetical protein
MRESLGIPNRMGRWLEAFAATTDGDCSDMTGAQSIPFGVKPMSLPTVQNLHHLRHHCPRALVKDLHTRMWSSLGQN